jgi:hypothetical protein
MASRKRVTVRRYTVDICDPCYHLEGAECHTPGCIFFLCDMKEVGEFLTRSLIRPRVDGERLDLKNLERAKVVSREV